jgi:FKBP-type peptidyl-prolyl cis-trans isomerase FkpA
MKFLFPLCLIIIFFLASCNNSSEKKVLTQKPRANEIADINSYLVQKDRERILNYIERKNLKMRETETGLWYLIREEGKGNLLREGDKFSYTYTCSLLDGTECYNSERNGPRELILGKGEVEAGLNEGFRLLKRGGEAVFILPPFLAFGLLGDGKCIPSRAVIVYFIHISE